VHKFENLCTVHGSYEEVQPTVVAGAYRRRKSETPADRYDAWRSARRQAAVRARAYELYVADGCDTAKSQRWWREADDELCGKTPEPITLKGSDATK